MCQLRSLSGMNKTDQVRVHLRLICLLALVVSDTSCVEDDSAQGGDVTRARSRDSGDNPIDDGSVIREGIRG